jgi:predicted transcriptional regulator
MAQISVVISDEEFKILSELAKETGRSNSSLAAEWIRRGIYEEISNQNKVEVWRSMVDKRRTREAQQTTQITQITEEDE